MTESPVQYILKSPVGYLTISEQNEKLLAVQIENKTTHPTYQKTTLATKLNQQLETYFKQPSKTFSIPFVLNGTDFQQRVWQSLTRIPAGEVRTYGELAKELKSSARAVGNACRRNPLPIIIPCHRVVAKQGIGGYDGKTAGTRLDIKRWLLNHEGVKFD